MIAAPAATLNITVHTSRMPHGSEFKRIQKAVEHLYYLVLFTEVPDYEDRDDTWESWHYVGTDLGVREAPTAAAVADRYVDSVHSGAREITIKATGNGKALERVAALLGNLKGAGAELAPGLTGRFAELLAQSVTSLSVGDVVGIEAGVANS